MEKVKLTQEQAKAIEYALSKTDDYEDDKDRLLRDISRDYVCFHNDLFPLNKIDIAVAAKALYVGYEVIPQYKVGDWIVVEDCPCDHIIGKVQKIKDIGHIEGYDTRYHYEDWWSDERKTKLRHATPEEIQQEKINRFFSQHGREPWELRKGDLLHEKGASFTVSYTNDEEVKFEESKFMFYWDKIKKNFKVACFVEQRLDL